MRSCSFCLPDHRAGGVEAFTGLSGSHLWSVGRTPPHQGKVEGIVPERERERLGGWGSGGPWWWWWWWYVCVCHVSQGLGGSLASEYSSTPLLEQIPATCLDWVKVLWAVVGPCKSCKKEEKKKNHRSNLCTLLNRVFYIFLLLHKALTPFHLSAPQTGVLFLFSIVGIISELFSCGEWLQKLFPPGDPFLLCFLLQ